MGRSRRRRTPFRAWGLLLTVVIAALIWQREWLAAVALTGILIFYLLSVRVTRCRVETGRQVPCKWRVRGFLGTCDYHVGYKKGLPVLARGAGFIGLPTFMWLRDDFRQSDGRTEPQPGPGADNPAPAPAGGRRFNYETITVLLAAVGVVIALAALVRDLLAG